MKKDIRIPLIVLGTIASLFIGSGNANATLFPIKSSAPTDGVMMDNGQMCNIACINNDPKAVRQYIDSFPAKAADKFFNANWQTQQAIIAAYNKDAKTTYTNSQAQVLMGTYLTPAISGNIPGINGQVTYKGETFYITNGTFTLHWVENNVHHYDIGIIDKDLNYRFGSNTRGNLKTTEGITWAYIDGAVVVGTRPTTVSGSLFPIKSSAPTDGVMMDNGQMCNIACINNDPKAVRQYIDSFPAKAADKFFNANWQTQQAIIAAYNKDAKTTYTNSQAQVIMSTYLTAAISGDVPGISGQVTYKGETFYITNGTFTLHWVEESGLDHYDIGIIDKDLNYRFGSNTRGNLKTTEGITWAYIDGSVVDLNATAPTISAFSGSPMNITAGQSATLTWASNGTKCVVNGVDKPATGTMTVTPTVTRSYEITCYKGTTASAARSVTITVTGTTSSGSTTNPYATNLSTSVQNVINTWITKNIKSRSTTLSSENYTKFVETIISRLEQIKAATPASNANKINVINYLVWELQDILNNAFFDGLFN